MTLSDHDDGIQSTQVEHVVSNYGDSSQSVQGKQAENNQDDEDQPVQQDEHAVPGSNIVEFDFSTLPQNPALTIEKTGDNVQMIVDLEFSQLESPQEIKALLQALIDYAAGSSTTSRFSSRPPKSIAMSRRAKVELLPSPWSFPF
ncbi:hypothetical protein BOTNAR_0272g00130 [Botryotinia narcissicola]|uniref:Uncharacterized protein n=1 Tax=Botryotinia narcissicola TaxID=278944 RepID=A0A4Z1IC77_9HELO|nr:hypothetical protein BOTNAR_0272g00130 [Botryotinia narcissicola]